MTAVFMGTPAIAVPCLDALVAWAGERVQVVTQPDRPKGRSGRPQPSPVKARALELGLSVSQPERLRGNESYLAELRAAAPDVIVVVAFGQLLPPAVLETPRLGCINVHFSALPRWRGAAPVQRAIMAGDTVTAVDTMLMDVGLDTGPVLCSEPVTIGADETAGELAERLGALAPAVLRRTLEAWSAGQISARPQAESEACAAPRLARADGSLNLAEPAARLYDIFRGVTPWPGARAVVAGEEIRVLAARPGVGHGAPGTVLAVDRDQGLLCAAGQDALWLRTVQAPGRAPVSGFDYGNGRRLRGEVSGSGF